MKSYSELITLGSYRERLEYLKLFDNNALSPRHMSGEFYRSHAWRKVRAYIISRDLGFDLGVFGVYIDNGPIIVHHINPINESDIIYQTERLLNPENLICTSTRTHNLIHYNRETEEPYMERRPGDTKLW